MPALVLAAMLVFAGACGQEQTTVASSSSPLRPGVASFDAFPDACTDLASCIGAPAAEIVAPEEVRVCKKYPAGTVNPPSVQIKLDVITHNVVGSPTNIVYTLLPNTCLKLWWSPGGTSIPDTVTIQELVPPGFTATSQVSTGVQVGSSFVTTTNPATPATTLTAITGGVGIPGVLIVFTNTPVPQEPELVNIGNFVWHDLDADGIQDVGEPGIPNVPVMLSNGATTTTDVNGGYAFTGLPAGTYTVNVGTPAGFAASPSLVGSPSTDSNGSGTSVTVLTGTDNTIDFGFYKLGALGDFVWNDTDADGVQDAGEPGIAGITVNLSNGATTTTDANGFYAFSNLPPATYTVTVATPAGYLASPTGAGTPSTDSNGSGASATIAGNTDTTLDFGFYRPTPSGTCVAITAVQGVAIASVTIAGSGGTGAPYTFSATGLPAGLTMSTGGTISGTPTVGGSFAYTVTIKDKDGNTGTINCTVVVNSPPSASCIAITAIKGKPISSTQLVGTGGAGGPYTFSATGLPAGIVISSSGVISGTPTVSGTFTYTVTITDKNGNKGSFQCTIVVTPPDITAPVCAVFAHASPAYMTYQDGGSGIVRLDVTTNLNSNFKVTISPAPAGTIFSGAQVNGGTLPSGTSVKFLTGQTGVIKVTAVKKTSGVASQLTVKATDGNGNTVTCDPIETTVTKLKQDEGNQTFYGVPYEERYVTIENGGLRALEIVVNGTTFKVKRLHDDEVRTVDIKSAMRPGLNNTITLIPKGRRGETADITIGPDKP